jgi:hypothetical protein
MNVARPSVLIVGETLSLAVRSMRSTEHVGILCAEGGLFSPFLLLSVPWFTTLRNQAPRCAYGRNYVIVGGQPGRVCYVVWVFPGNLLPCQSVCNRQRL